MSKTTFIVHLLEKNEHSEPTPTPTPIDPTPEEAGQSIPADVPNTGLFSRSDALTTGVSVFGSAFVILSISYLIFKKLKTKSQKNQKSIASNKVNYKKKSTLAFKSLIFVSFLTALGFLTSSIIQNTKGAEANIILPVSSPAELTLDANILGSDDIASREAKLEVASVPSSGFSLYLRASDTKLVNKDDETVAISSITKPGTLEDNTFGYTLENPEGKEDQVTWYPLTTDEQGYLIAQTETANKDSVSIYFGIRSKSLKPGEYTLNLDFFAFGNENDDDEEEEEEVIIPETMQEMTSRFCDTLNPEDQYTLPDVRDGKTYTIQKLADGNCWMMQNLDLDLVEGVALTPETTDISSDFIPDQTTQTEDNLEWAYNESCYNGGSIDECIDSATPAYSYDPGDKAEGNFYSILSASAKKFHIIDSTTATIDGSICPKGWKMAQTDNYTNLFEAEGFELSDLSSEQPILYGEPISLFNTTGGGYFGTPFFPGSFGFGQIGYWGDIGADGMLINGVFHAYPSAIIQISALADEEPSYATYKVRDLFDGNYGYELDGGPIRCLVPFSSVNVNYDKNTTDSVSNLPSSEKFNHEGETEITLSEKTPVRDGYVFAGWATSPDGSAVYSPGGTLTALSPEITLYAVWYKSVPGVETMQSMTAEVCNTLTPEETYGLRDVRDGKFYTVSLLSDGHCWMTDDLKLILTAGETLTNETTDLNSKSAWTVPYSTDIDGEPDWDYDDTRSYYWSKAKTVYYNSYSATAESSKTADENTRFYPDSICPKGWYLPTKSDYETLIGEYTYEEMISSPVNLKFNGYFDKKDDEPRDENRYIKYWTSSTYGYNYGSYYLNGDIDGDSLYFSNGYYYNGHNIRCAIKAPTITVHFDKNTEETVTGMPGDLEVENTNNITTTRIPNIEPERSGYRFVGWSTDKNADPYSIENLLHENDDITIYGGALTLYAIWQPPTPKAILDEEGNLDFVYDLNVYTVGEAYHNSLGNDTLINQVCSKENSSFFSDNGESGGNCNNKNSIRTASFAPSFKNYQPTSTNYWFYYDTGLKDIYNLENLDTSNITKMYGMFSGASSLTSLTLPEGFGTNTTNMGNMFAGASSLESLVLPEGFGKEATYMYGMFSQTSSLKSLILPEGFGKEANDMGWMFSQASSLESLVLPEGFGSKAGAMECMFVENTSLRSLTLPSGFGAVAYITSRMFDGASSLEHIYVEAGTDWSNYSSINDSSNMFAGAASLPDYDESNANDITNAHINGTGSTTGYFEDVANKPAEEEQTEPLGVIKTAKLSSTEDNTPLITVIVLSVALLTTSSALLIVKKRQKDEEN